jgi:multiple sugar transport system substrate-binding protein
MNMKKGMNLLITGIMMFSLLAACSNSTKQSSSPAPAASSAPSATTAPTPTPAAEKPVTIKMMQYTASGSQEATLAEMVKAFETANPNIKVQVEVVAYADYYTKLNTMVNAGSSAPDVFEVGYENFVTYASKGVLLDLSPQIAADKDFKPDTYKKLAYDAFKYDGKQYGMVEAFSDVVMFYNKDLFDKAKVEYPKASWTWKEELEAAQKLTDAKAGVWGTFAPIQFYEFYKTIAQNGGSIFSSDNKTVTVNSKENVEALTWMLDKARKYKVSPALNDDTFNQPDADLNAFKAGKIAMLRAGIWNFGGFKDLKFKWDIALEPGNTKKAHHFFADGLTVSKDTKNAEAAWKFVKFMTSNPAAVNKRIEKGWSVPAVADAAIMDSYYKQTPPESKKVVIEALDSLVLPPVGPLAARWNDLQTAVSEEIDKAKLGKIDAQTALDNAKGKIEKIMPK